MELVFSGEEAAESTPYDVEVVKLDPLCSSTANMTIEQKTLRQGRTECCKTMSPPPLCQLAFQDQDANTKNSNCKAVCYDVSMKSNLVGHIILPS
jgi:hypothetical protein